MALSPAEMAAVYTVVGAIIMGLMKFYHDYLDSRISSKADESVEEEVGSLKDSHRETRRLAEASYATVHGDDDRPADAGFVVESEEKWDELGSEVAELRRAVNRIEQQQEQHQQRLERVLTLVAEKLDGDFMFRSDGGEPDDEQR